MIDYEEDSKDSVSDTTVCHCHVQVCCSSYGWFGKTDNAGHILVMDVWMLHEFHWTLRNAFENGSAKQCGTQWIPERRAVIHLSQTISTNSQSVVRHTVEDELPCLCYALL